MRVSVQLAYKVPVLGPRTTAAPRPSGLAASCRARMRGSPGVGVGNVDAHPKLGRLCLWVGGGAGLEARSPGLFAVIPGSSPFTGGAGTRWEIGVGPRGLSPRSRVLARLTRGEERSPAPPARAFSAPHP
ncbi:uncharacterized protein LOC132541740 [Erinaceus europaeus]|uniref:Uncharacterized protein LOC132541740 n=1 Tax=Erinaceus europaeus TaxID=9365 RepID=A0ABM3YBI0_ERIEU|nr:uncharacterized protein LOC132541740 [Erinaceus europaeus]